MPQTSSSRAGRLLRSIFVVLTLGALVATAAYKPARTSVSAALKHVAPRTIAANTAAAGVSALSRFQGYFTIRGMGTALPLTLTVTNTNDAGAGSLRQAIIDANANGVEGGTINFDASLVSGGDATISLSTFDTGLDDGEFGPTALIISSPINITGPTGSNGITINRSVGSNFRLFHITATGSLTLVNLTLSGGNAQGFNGGNAEAPGNGAGGGGAAGLGGAILNQGTLVLSHSLLTGNTAKGGAGGAGGAGGGGSTGGGGGGLGSAGGNGSGSNGGDGGSPNGGVAGGNGGIGGGGGSSGGIGGFGGGGSGGGVAQQGKSGGFGGGGGGAGGFAGGGAAGPAGFGGGAGSGAGQAGGGGGGGLGGAVFNDGGTVTILNSTFSANTAEGGLRGDASAESGSGLGGGLFNLNGTVNVTNATFSNNIARNGNTSPANTAGGAIFNLAHETANGITDATAAVTLNNTILANSIATSDLANEKSSAAMSAANINTNAFNIVEVTNNTLGTVSGTSTTTDPALGALADNGGPTFTHEITASSAAAGAGNNTAANNAGLTTDQRGFGFPRFNGTVDIGAFEASPLPEINVKGNGTSIADGDTTPSVADDTDFGTVTSGTVSHTFTIENTGSADLNLTGTPKVLLSGANATDFTVTAQPGSPVGSGGTTSFTIQFAPNAAGTRTATVSIANDDADENPYDFAIQGTSVSPGMALNFDGSNDFTERAPLASLGSGDFTFEFLFKANSTATFPVLFAQDQSGIGTPAFRVEINSNNNSLSFFLSSSGANVAVSTAANSVPIGVCTHYAIVRSGNTFTAYINGVQSGTATASGTPTLTGNNFNFRIGARRNSSNTAQNPFNGLIDEFRVWTVARTASEISANRNSELTGTLPASLRLYYKFSQGVAGGNNAGVTTLQDSTANGLNSTLNNFALSGATSNWVGMDCFISQPEMNVKGNNVSIVDGDATPSTTDDTDFGAITSGTVSHTFTIENTGTNALNLTGTPKVVIGGANASDFSVTSQPASPVAAGGTTTFTVQFTPTASGLRTATLSIANNDSDENPYDFSIQGTFNVVTLTVTNTNDSGAGSLRQAITDSNNLAGVQTIAFNIPGSGVQTIAPTSQLPFIFQPAIIDGATQPGFAGTPLIEISGANAGNSQGIFIAAGSSTVRALIINGFSNGSGINLDTNGGNTVKGCYIGTNASGTAALPNSAGITITSSNNQIGGAAAGEGNLISGHSTNIGINTGASASGNIIQGNRIGTNADGTAAIPNAGGIIIRGTNNLIGGAGAGNLIAGNSGTGLMITDASATGNTAQGNMIGTNAAGTAAIGNAGPGVSIISGAAFNTVGGTAPGAGNVISGSTNNDGVQMTGAGTANNIVQGNRIGTNAAGTAKIPNAFRGVSIFNSAGANTIGGTAAGAGNLISGNTLDGIFISGVSGCVVQGNLIGTDVTGNASLGNSQSGIIIQSSANNNTIGGDNSANGPSDGIVATCNVISGNGTAGVVGDGVVISGATGNTVLGNRIGTNAAGTAAVANAFNGVRLQNSATGNTIGGTTTGARNILSGNTVNGVLVQTGAGTNTIRGNFIGTDATGAVALPNNFAGVNIFGPGGSNSIGGSTAAARNVISGNAGRGVIIQSASLSNSVRGNFIGVAADGSSALGNTGASGRGIEIIGSSNNNQIGGTSAGEGNIIANNALEGIAIGSSSTGIRIQGNSIYANNNLGIDLTGDGVTPNDAGDADTGANNLQNFPVLTSAITNAGTTTVAGTLDSTANSTFRIEFFSNPTCDPSGNGEGQTFLGFVNVTTNGSGIGSFNTTIPIATSVGQVLTTTATNTSTGDTSEFSACRTIAAPTPEMDVKGNGVSIADGDASPSLADHTDFGSAAVAGGTVSRTFTIENTGTSALNLTGTPKVVVSGANASDFNVTAQPSSPVSSGGATTFSITFDPSASGTRTATISIANNDADENPYDFAIQGSGTVINTAPVVTVDNSVVTVNEGSAATNTGTFSDVDGDNVTLSASVGTVSAVPPGALLSDLTTGGRWRTASVTKSADVDGNNVYGSDGYGMYGLNGVETVVNPSYATITRNPSLSFFPGNGGYRSIDDPNNPGAAQKLSGVIFNAPGGSNPTTFFTVTFTQARTVRMGIVVDNADFATISPTTLRLRQTAGGTRDTGFLTAGTPASRDRSVDYYFFDITANAGDAYEVSGNNDPAFGSNGIAGVFFDTGAGSSTASGTYTWSFTPPDGPAGPTTVTITATDNGNPAQSSNTTFTLNVNNVAPTIALTGDNSVNQNASYTLNLGAITDPGTDTVTAYSVNWGDGNTDNFNGNPSGASKTHTYASVGSKTITVALTDEDGTFNNAGTKSVTVNAQATVAISGRLTGTTGAGLAGLTLNLSGSQSATTTSDANGNYAFASLAQGGNYTVAPAPSDFDFTPPNRDFTNLTANGTGDFTGRRVRAATPTGTNVSVQIEDVTINFANVTTAGTTTVNPINPATAGTLPSGYFLNGGSVAIEATTTAVVSGSIVVTVSTPSISDPAIFSEMRVLHGEGGTLVDRTILAPDAPAPNFATRTLSARVPSLSPFVVAQNPGHTISGRVTDADNNPIVGVNISLSGSQSRETTTDANGNYSFNGVPEGGNYTVTPSQVAFLFSPASRTFNNFIADQTANFTGSPSSFAITGRVTNASSGAGLSGVTLTLSGVTSAVTTTDAAGNYAFAGVAASGDYTLTAEAIGFDFNPTRRDFVNLNSNQTADFVGTAQPIAVVPPPVSDGFDSPVRDPAKWSEGTLSQPDAANDPQVTVEQKNGMLVITPRADANGLSFNGFISTKPINLDETPTASLEVVQPATGDGAVTLFSVGVDNNNFYRIAVQSADSPGFAAKTEAMAEAVTSNSTAQVILFQTNLNGTKFSTGLPYDPVQFRFWRFRFEKPALKVHLETSPDAQLWTTRLTADLAPNVNALISELAAGTTGPTSNVGAASLDNYALTQTRVQFASSGFSAPENGGNATITVTRTGNTESTSLVGFATEDGTAKSDVDYTAITGTVSFAIGETSKTFNVRLIDDNVVEPDETVNLVLFNSRGAIAVGESTRATLTILDDDAGRNPIDRTDFFVRQHYLDFLGREPDQAGLAFWTNNIESCGTNAVCRSAKRVDTSAAFFLSIEFQQTGYVVDRFYLASYKRTPTFAEYLPDLQIVRTGVIIGEPGAEARLELNKQAFAELWTKRAEFKQKYDGLNDMQYVDTLASNAGVTLREEERTELITGLLTKQTTRTGALLRIVDNPDFITNETNRAFVLMEYFGYLRRDPDAAGFQFWLNKLNAFGGDFRRAEMVKAFITSIEYRSRFGQP